MQKFKAGDKVKFKSTASKNAIYFNNGLENLTIKGFRKENNYNVYESDKSTCWVVEEYELEFMENQLVFTPSQQREIYNMACDTWKPIIAKAFEDSIFNDCDCSIDSETFEVLVKTSTPEQLETFKKMQPLYFKENVLYKVGDRFIHSETQWEYILTTVDEYKVCLINLENGNRYEDSITVKNNNYVTRDEFSKITGNDADYFKKI